MAELLEAGDVPNGPVNSVADALALNQTVARGMIVEIDDPQRGRIKTLGSPFRFDFQSEATLPPGPSVRCSKRNPRQRRPPQSRSRRLPQRPPRRDCHSQALACSI